MSQPFYSDATKAKNVSFFFFFFLVTLLISTRFLRNYCTNTPLEPLQRADVPFMGYKTETKDLGRTFGRKIDFWL